MITIRPSNERGATSIGWLESRHSFSFGEYHDPAHMGFHGLRVINDDIIAAGQGFGMHGHRDMEIISIVLEGELEHRDSLGNGAVLRPGEVQAMSAGSGIRHSEFNPSPTTATRLLQVWISPMQSGATPRYAQREFPLQTRQGKLITVASPDGRAGSLPIHQNASLQVTLLDPGERVTHAIAPGRSAWLQVATGALTLNGHALSAGDGAAITREAALELVGTSPGTQALLFDLA